MPINDQVIISTFENSVKTDYKTSLTAMFELVEKYINAAGKSVWLVVALLEMLMTDKTIKPQGTNFTFCKTGRK